MDSCVSCSAIFLEFSPQLSFLFLAEAQFVIQTSTHKRDSNGDALFLYEMFLSVIWNINVTILKMPVEAKYIADIIFSKNYGAQ